MSMCIRWSKLYTCTPNTVMGSVFHLYWRIFTAPHWQCGSPNFCQPYSNSLQHSDNTLGGVERLHRFRTFKTCKLYTPPKQWWLWDGFCFPLVSKDFYSTTLTIWLTNIPAVSHLIRGFSNTSLRRVCLRIFNGSLLVIETICPSWLDVGALDTQMEVVTSATVR